jgi:signal transduction histidine kinase
MTKPDARLSLHLRQRRFEWALAREEHTRAAARLVAGKTHGLLNLIQIIQLASQELEKHCDPTVRPYIGDLDRSAAEARQALGDLMAAARPPAAPPQGSPIREPIDAAVDALREAFDLGLVDVQVSAPAEAATRCTAEELEHLVLGLVLDLADERPSAAPIRLVVREREIEGAPWIEFVRVSDAAAPHGERFELRVVETIARRAGGELTTSEGRGGGEELVVALPEVAA